MINLATTIEQRPAFFGAVCVLGAGWLPWRARKKCKPEGKTSGLFVFLGLTVLQELLDVRSLDGHGKWVFGTVIFLPGTVLIV